MEETVARPRYARRTVPARRYRKSVRDSGRLPRIIARQLLIALVLLLVVGIIKSINNPVTNFLSDKVRLALTQNIELKNVYDYVDRTLASLKNSMAPDTGEASPAGADTTGTEAIYGPAAPDAGGLAQAGSRAGGDIPTEPETAVLSATYEEEPKAFLLGMQAPVSGVLSSRFGERTDPFTKAVKFHEGIDIEAARGADIKAALEGVVDEAGSSPSYGNYLKLSHEGGLETIYAHCSSLIVEKGKKIKRGDVIAKVGDSGASVGVHLHFEVLKDGRPVNPLDYIAFADVENQD